MGAVRLCHSSCDSRAPPPSAVVPPLSPIASVPPLPTVTVSPLPPELAPPAPSSSTGSLWTTPPQATRAGTSSAAHKGERWIDFTRPKYAQGPALEHWVTDCSRLDTRLPRKPPRDERVAEDFPTPAQTGSPSTGTLTPPRLSC